MEELDAVVEVTKAPVFAAPRPEPYHKRLRKMSHRQLRGEMRRSLKNEKGAPGLTAIFMVVLGTVLDNTTSSGNPGGKLHPYPR